MPGLPAPTTPAPTRSVTDEERATFERDGVVLLRQIHPLEWVDYLREQLDQIFDRSDADPYATWSGASAKGDRVDMAEVISRYQAADPDADLALDGGPDSTMTGRSIVETDPGNWHAGLRTHHIDGPLPQVVGELTASNKVNYYSDQIFLKEPGSLTRTPFHQDQPYFLVQGGTVAVCWVPVDHVTLASGSMGYVTGSHKWNKLFKPSDFVTNTGTFLERGGIDLGGLDVLPAQSEFIDDVVYFDAEPGDVIVHHWATIHGSSGNTTAGQLRRAASVRFAGEGCVFHRRRSSPEPFRNTIDLAEGDDLELSARFPVVWRQSS